MRDRTVTDQMALTHEFLAEMLGVRRATVTQIIERLEATGAIEPGHGRIVIADRERLEASACDCSRAVKAKATAVYAAPLAGATRSHDRTRVDRGTRVTKRVDRVGSR